MTSAFCWDEDHDRPALDLDDIAKDGIEFQAFGSDYDNVDTMFAIFADGERILTTRPEPLLISFLEDIIEESAFTMYAGEKPFRVNLDKGRREKLAEIVEHLKNANAPLQ